MKKLLLSAGMLCTTLFAAAQCEPQATLNEDFSNFTMGTSNVFPQNCWSTANTGWPSVLIYTAQAGEPLNQYATFYASTAVNTYGYLISPEVSTFDGGHQLSFSTWKLAQGGNIPAGTVTVQPGTISDITDTATFTAYGDAITVTSGTVENHTNIIIPSAPAGSHIAFRISADTAHNAMAIDNVVWDTLPATGCEAVAAIDEDFTDFEGGAFPQNCWTSSHQAPMTSVDADEEGSEEKSITVYSFFSPNTPIYVVSPEVSTIDGSHALSFTANIQAGSMPGGASSLQIGTLSDPADFTTYVPFGNAIALTSTPTTYDNIVLPVSETHRYIAFQFTASLAHVAAALDNVIWASSIAGTGTVKANAFSIFPNPSTDKNVTLTYNNITSGHVSVYAVTGAKVFETAVGGNTQNINLSALASGMYVVKLESGNVSATQKLIIK